MSKINGNSPERDASWMTLDYVEKQLKAATDELEEDHQRASHAFAAAEDGSAEQQRAYQDRKAAHHESMGIYRARRIISRAHVFDPAKAAREANRALAGRVADDRRADDQECVGCGDHASCVTPGGDPFCEVCLGTCSECGDHTDYHHDVTRSHCGAGV